MTFGKTSVDLSTNITPKFEKQVLITVWQIHAKYIENPLNIHYFCFKNELLVSNVQHALGFNADDEMCEMNDEKGAVDVNN